MPCVSSHQVCSFPGTNILEKTLLTISLTHTAVTTTSQILRLMGRGEILDVEIGIIQLVSKIQNVPCALRPLYMERFIVRFFISSRNRQKNCTCGGKSDRIFGCVDRSERIPLDLLRGIYLF